MTLVVVITHAAAIKVVSRIFLRAVVASPLPPYHAARKQQPITPALARSFSRRKETRLSNSHERPATLLMPSRSCSLAFMNQLPIEISNREGMASISVYSQIGGVTLRRPAGLA